MMWIRNIKTVMITKNTELLHSFIYSTNMSTHYTSKSDLSASDTAPKKQPMSSWNSKEGGRQTSKQLKVD